MKIALQRCCTTPAFLRQYETSTNAVLEKMGVELVDVDGLNCCGYPIKNFDFKAHVLASARNLSLTEREGLNLMTLCNCCYGTLRHVDHLLKQDDSLREEINESLFKEGLEYNNQVQVKPLLEVFYRDIGLKETEEKLVRRFEGLKIATHYGCHLLRPRQIVQFDNPQAPTIFDKLVEITGAESIPWPSKLECCGSPMYGIDDDLSMDLTEKKVSDARQSGAHFLCAACCFCQLQFDRVQKSMIAQRGENHNLPSILYTQLLGLSLGIDLEELGLEKNEMDATGITDFLN
jgi:heterodisulfide reductase subunit B